MAMARPLRPGQNSINFCLSFPNPALWRKVGCLVLFWLLCGAINPLVRPVMAAPTLARLPSSSPTPSDPAAYPAHYLVFKVTAAGRITPVAYRSFASQAAFVSLADEVIASQLQQPRPEARRFVVSLQTATGQILYQTWVETPTWLRTEEPGAPADDGSTPLQGQRLLNPASAFVVRLPAWDQGDPHATLVLQEVGRDFQQRFALQPLIRAAALRSGGLPAPQNVAHVTGGGADPANRVDLLLLGDGYPALEESKFLSDTARVANGFFTLTPFANYRNYFNVHFLFTPSQEAGADHPPYDPNCTDSACCSDSDMQFDARQNTFVETAFDARFCTGQVYRALTVDHAKVLEAAAAVPEWDQILVLVNETAFGGTGGYLAVFSTTGDVVGTAQHEFGHAFVLLADEYEYAGGFTSCSDRFPFFGSCPPNITDVTDRHQLKWSPWVSPTTPIPTVPEFDSAFANTVGLFEGAGYQSTDYYRSGQSCLMRALGRPFCQVPSQAFVLRLYGGGWGVPAAGIQLIEPRGTVPLAQTIALTYPHTATFQVQLLQPVGAPPVQSQWWVNGLAVTGALSTTYIFTPTQPFTQPVSIEIRVRDVTPLVHPALAGELLTSRRTWFVLPGDQIHTLYLPLIFYRNFPVFVPGPAVAGWHQP